MHLAVAVPMMAEYDNLTALLASLRRQSFHDFSLYCCVNQPDVYAYAPAASPERAVFDDNQASLRLLDSAADLSPVVLDCSSPGRGWSGKRSGVGWARKCLFDTIVSHHDDSVLVVSLDADTAFPDDYLQVVHDTVSAYPGINALCVPYLHPLSGVEDIDRAMLRYECYMRHYLTSLLRIHSPYAFTALGSAMAFSVGAYKRVGGMAPLQGGEDFYLMQKFAKTGPVLLDVPTCVSPQGRASHRVPFGTGPAIARGVAGQQKAYPFFAFEGFTRIADTYALLPQLFTADVVTPMSDFQCRQLAVSDPWSPLRKNFKTPTLFVRACHERIDGLRILQYLKSLSIFDTTLPDFANAPLCELVAFRAAMCDKEAALRHASPVCGLF